MVSIREVVPTANGFTGADKTVSATTCLAGDTLVIAHACTTNPFPGDPTSSAGTLVQAATVTNGFAGRCRLRVYTCPVASSGNKTVTFTGGTTGDIQGHVFVIAGAVAVDGTPSTNPGVDLGTASHIINAVSPAGAADLLIGFIAAFQTAAGANYWTPPGSMSEDAESFDANFLGLWSGHEQLAASGSTGTRTVTAVTSDNRYVSIGIAVSPAGLTQAIGVAAEADAAQAIGRIKSRALGIAAATELAMPLGGAPVAMVGRGAITFADTGSALLADTGAVQLLDQPGVNLR